MNPVGVSVVAHGAEPEAWNIETTLGPIKGTTSLVRIRKMENQVQREETTKIKVTRNMDKHIVWKHLFKTHHE